MNILQINNYGYMRGGSETYFLALQKLLQENNHHVVPFTIADKRNAVSTWSGYWPKGVDLEAPSVMDVMRFIYSPESRRYVARLCDRFRPCVAHLHIYYGQLTTAVLREVKKRGIPVVQTLHEYKLLCPVYTRVYGGRICHACNGRHFWHAASRRCNRNSFARSLLSATESYVSHAFGSWDDIDHFIAVSDFVRHEMVAAGLPQEKITTVHNFIDTQHLNPSNEQGDYFLYFGRLERIKGVMTLLDAMRHSPGRLVFAGNGPARSEMEVFIRHHGMRNVTFMGFKEGRELHDLIRASRCVIAPSEWHEPFGLVLVEAFAFGRPVIASRIGGMTEIVEEEKNGLLFSPGSVEELAQAMRWMWEHPIEALSMGQWGRALAEKKFTPQQHYAELSDVYRKVMQ